MAPRYNFGGTTGVTPEDLKRRRAMARSLMSKQASPQDIPGGITAIGNALQGRIMMNRADSAEKEGRQSAADDWAKFEAGDISAETFLGNPYGSKAHQAIAMQIALKDDKYLSTHERAKQERERATWAVADAQRKQQQALLASLQQSVFGNIPGMNPAPQSQQAAQEYYPTMGPRNTAVAPDSSAVGPQQSVNPQPVAGGQPITTVPTDDEIFAPAPTMATVLEGGSQNLNDFQQKKIATLEASGNMEEAKIEATMPQSTAMTVYQKLHDEWKARAMIQAVGEAEGDPGKTMQLFVKYLNQMENDNRDDTRQLRKDFTQEDMVKSFTKISQFYETMRAAAETSLDTPGQSDHAFIVGFMKLLDENSAVMQGEAEAGANTVGWRAKAAAVLANIKGGGDKLDGPGRQQFLDIAHQIYLKSHGRMSGVAGDYSNIVQDNRIAPVGHVVSDMYRRGPMDPFVIPDQTIEQAAKNKLGNSVRLPQGGRNNSNSPMSAGGR